MTFLYPSFLFGLLAVAVPVAIHLFNFRRIKKVYFTNVEFLQSVKTATNSFRKLKQWLILAARCLFVIFLVLAFARWAGKDAILPMAIFYCTIHFGKPLGECISSYFGGMILGVVSYHTRTIIGGFLVHVGIAWLMELGGYIGHLNF